MQISQEAEEKERTKEELEQLHHQKLEEERQKQAQLCAALSEKVQLQQQLRSSISENKQLQQQLQKAHLEVN